MEGTEAQESAERALGEGTFSVEKFVESFPVLVEATGGIGGLRTLAMQLAVQGRFTTRESRDGTGAELLEGLRRHKSKLVSAKLIRGGVSAPEDGISPPFSIPATWVWTRFGEIGDWGSGSTPNRSMPAYFGGKTLWLKSGELNDGRVSQSEETVTEKALNECSLRLNKPGDVLIAMYGATIGKTAVLEVEATTNQAVCACTCFPGVFNEYLLLVLRAFKPLFVGQGAGGAQPNISKEKIVATLMPLPPLAEQKRIVARVDQIMALIDQLEAKQNRKRDLGARFTKASLEALTTAEILQDFTTAWTRIQSTWPPLLDHPDKVGEVRRAVLDLAIRGSLAGEDRLRQVREGTPFGIPNAWRWLTVGEVAEKLTDGEHIQPRFAQTGVPMLSAKHIGTNGVDLSDFKFVAEIDASRFRQRCDPQPGDLLIVGRGSIGKTCEVQPDAPVFCLMGSVILLRLSTSLDPRFFLMVFRSSYGQAQLFGRSRAMAQPALYLRDIQHLSLPIPPLAQQKRIVAKVEHLMKLCDALEAALRRRDDRAAKLAEAVVQEMVA